MKYEIQGIGDSVIQDYAEYGEYVNKFRHVPLLEDGLKPVYRRLILTALEEPAGKKVKTAKLIGDNMSCFTGDTVIAILQGNNPELYRVEINELLMVDFEKYPILTLSANEEGSMVKSRIMNVTPMGFREDIIKLTLDNGESFKCTSDHKFLTPEGYVEADKLNESHNLISWNFQFRHVTNKELSNPEMVYDVGVDHEWHNFTLGAGVVAKNCRHPHGTQGIVNVVAELVRAGIFDPQGSFGSKGMLKWCDYPPAAERYSEVCIKPEWREMVGKLLPYVPHHENDYGKSDPDYLAVPIPLGLNMGNMGIGVGMAVNLPSFEFKSLIKAGYAALCKKPEPWKLLQANGLTISDEDKEKFWNNSKGVITYRFNVSPSYSGGLQGWAITGNPSFVKPRTNKLFKVQGEGGKLVIRDESARDVNRLFVARAKRIKTITDTEVENLVREAAEVPRAFSLYAVYNGQSRPITGGVWIQKTMLNYNEIVKKYKVDQIQKIDSDITAYQYFRQVADKILNTKESYEDISKNLGIDLGIVKRISTMGVGTLRTTDPVKKIQSLKEKRKTFETLTTKDMLKEFLK